MLGFPDAGTHPAQHIFHAWVGAAQSPKAALADLRPTFVQSGYRSKGDFDSFGAGFVSPSARLRRGHCGNAVGVLTYPVQGDTIHEELIDSLRISYICVSNS